MSKTQLCDRTAALHEQTEGLASCILCGMSLNFKGSVAAKYGRKRVLRRQTIGLIYESLYRGPPFLYVMKNMIKIDKNEFFRQATLRICSSLDVETALSRTLHYLKEYIPLSGILYFTYEAATYTIKPVISVTKKEGVRKFKRDIQLPKEVIQRMEEMNDPIEPDISIDNHMEMNREMGNLLSYIHDADASVIRLKLNIEGKEIGYLAFYTEEGETYLNDHAYLIQFLKEPLSVGVLNSRRYQTIVGKHDVLVENVRSLRDQLSDLNPKNVIGGESGLKNVMESVGLVAPMDNPVLVLGETGVGKEVVANHLHRQSGRKNGPFITINCGAIPENLIDSELFGHEKGAFTGAVDQKQGCFERARGGTIFLDEIGELTLKAQVRLLRVLQNKEIVRVGGDRPIPIDTRIVAATHRNLQQMVAAGTFRDDLWFRLNVYPIPIPPLRSRLEDIGSLVSFFAEKKAREMGFRSPPMILPEMIDRLKSYSWPGNVRELENSVERALIEIRRNPDQQVLHIDDCSGAWLKEPPQAALPSSEDFDQTLDEHIADYIRRVLEKTGGKIYGPGGAAGILGLNHSTLRSKMDRLGIVHGRKNTGAK